MDWFRSWHGAPTDNKWLVIAKRAMEAPLREIVTNAGEGKIGRLL